MADDRNQTPDETRHDTAARGETDAGYESRGDVVDREREQHGGVKVGAAFFGWLAATGMAVLLGAVVAATGVLAGEATETDSPSEVADALNLQLDELGVVGVVAALAIWFVAYYSGGYVAGRMARFDGIKQGVAVWAWALVVAILIGVLAAFAGDDYTVTAGLPDLDLERTTSVVVGGAVVALVSLVGAMLGGLAGMRFHRRVDRTGLGR